MKTFLTVVFLVLLALVWFHRDRVYLRDPLATVYRDGVAQSGVRVFMNGFNDILLEKEGGQDRYRVLIQHWNQAPGTPKRLRCIEWMACLTDAAHPETIPLGSGTMAADGSTGAPAAAAARPHPPSGGLGAAAIENGESFVAPSGVRVRVTLR